MSQKKNPNKCLIDECINLEANRGYCYKHYKRLQVHGDPLTLLQTDCKGKLCSMAGCDVPARKRLLCNSHYTLHWRKENPERAKVVIKQSWINRLARKKGAEGNHSQAEWQALLDEHDGLCAYCKNKPATERDHVIPIAKGGTHNIDNILPACRNCNRRKWTKSMDEFLSVLGATNAQV